MTPKRVIHWLLSIVATAWIGFIGDYPRVRRDTVMANLVIVPNALASAINAAIDRALAGRPCTDDDREFIYQKILTYYDEHGVIPDFTLTANGGAA